MTTKILTTYRIQFRRPTVDGLHGYDGPAWVTDTVTVTLCDWHKAWVRPALFSEWGTMSIDAAACDACENPGKGLFAIIIERVLGL